MAIGSGANDAGMLEWVGFAAALGNARDEVKALADFVYPVNDIGAAISSGSRLR